MGRHCTKCFLPSTSYNPAKSLQSCPTLCGPIDGSPPGYPIPGILQARILEWVEISFSNVWKWKVKVKSLSRVRLLATLWTAAYQAPPSMGFSRQEYWSGVPLPSPIILSVFWRSMKTPKLREAKHHAWNHTVSEQQSWLDSGLSHSKPGLLPWS